MNPNSKILADRIGKRMLKHSLTRDDTMILSRIVVEASGLTRRDLARQLGVASEKSLVSALTTPKREYDYVRKRIIESDLDVDLVKISVTWSLADGDLSADFWEIYDAGRHGNQEQMKWPGTTTAVPKESFRSTRGLGRGKR
jgi:transcriptional regulator with XRE-family HTH domain